MRQMKKAAAKAKVDEAVTTAKNAIDQATKQWRRHCENKWRRCGQQCATNGC